MSDKIRHTRNFHCPVCNGHVDLPQGKGIRCAGFTSADKEWTRCTREEYAGSAPPDDRTNPASYVHRMKGECKCGVEHNPAENAPTPLKRETKYEVRSSEGELIAIHYRIDEGGKKKIWWDPKGVVPSNLPLYGAHGLRLLEDGSRVIVTEGEKAAQALLDIGIAAVGTVTGASAIPCQESLEVLKRFTVYLWPDNDTPGRKHMASIAEALANMGIDSQTIQWKNAPDKGDAWDWLAAGNSDISSLLNEGAKTESFQWERDDDIMVARTITPAGLELRFTATDIRNSYTGVHATVSIWVGSERYEHTILNVGRGPDRKSIANNAFDRFNNLLKTAIPEAMLRKAFDDFCIDLWDRYNGSIEVITTLEDIEDEPIAFIQRPYLLEEAGTILYGLKGGGKTYSGLGIAITVHNGIRESPYGAVPRARKCLYVNIERGEKGIQRRIRRMNACLGLPRNTPLPFISARGKTLKDVIGRIKTAVKEEGVEVVFIDSLSRTGEGSLQKDDTANAIMDALNALGCSWFTLAHMAKGKDREDDEHSIYGSVMFANAADIVIYLRSERDGNSRTAVLEVTDANDAPIPPARYIRYDFDPEYGISDVTRVDQADAPALAQRVMTNREKIADFLRDGAQTAEDIAERLGIPEGSVRRILSDKAFIAVGKQDGKTLYGKSDRASRSGDQNEQIGSDRPVIAPSRLPEIESENVLGRTSPPLGGVRERAERADPEEKCARCARSAGDNFGYDAEENILCATCLDDFNQEAV